MSETRNKSLLSRRHSLPCSFFPNAAVDIPQVPSQPVMPFKLGRFKPVEGLGSIAAQRWRWAYRAVVLQLRLVNRMRASERWLTREDSSFRKKWDILIVLLSFYTAVTTPAYLALEYMPSGALLGIECFIDILFIVNILVHCCTAYYDQARIVTARLAILKRYASSWMLLDIVSSFPTGIVMAFLPNAEQTVVFSSIARILRLIKLSRVLRVHKTAHVSNTKMRLINLVGYFFMFAYWVGCIWIFISKEEGWLGNGFIFDMNFSEKSSLFKLTYALFWGLSNLTSLGSNLRPDTPVEVCFAVLISCLGLFIFAAIIGNINAVIARMDAQDQKHRERRAEIGNFLRHHRFPSDLKARVKMHYDLATSSATVLDTRTVSRYLPVPLQMEVARFVHREFFANNVLFQQNDLLKNFDESFLNLLSLALQPRHAFPGEVIYHRGDVGDSLFFVQSGTCNAVSVDKQKVYSIFDAGSFFGEAAVLLPDTGRSTTVVALTMASLLELTKRDLDSLLSAFPSIRQLLTDIAATRNQVGRFQDPHEERSTLQAVKRRNSVHFGSPTRPPSSPSSTGIASPRGVRLRVRRHSSSRLCLSSRRGKTEYLTVGVSRSSGAGVGGGSVASTPANSAQNSPMIPSRRVHALFAPSPTAPLFGSLKVKLPDSNAVKQPTCGQTFSPRACASLSPMSESGDETVAAMPQQTNLMGADMTASSKSPHKSRANDGRKQPTPILTMTQESVHYTSYEEPSFERRLNAPRDCLDILSPITESPASGTHVNSAETTSSPPRPQQLQTTCRYFGDSSPIFGSSFSVNCQDCPSPPVLNHHDQLAAARLPTNFRGDQISASPPALNHHDQLVAARSPMNFRDDRTLSSSPASHPDSIRTTHRALSLSPAQPPPPATTQSPTHSRTGSSSSLSPLTRKVSLSPGPSRASSRRSLLDSLSSDSPTSPSPCGSSSSGFNPTGPGACSNATPIDSCRRSLELSEDATVDVDIDCHSYEDTSPPAGSTVERPLSEINHELACAYQSEINGARPGRTSEPRRILRSKAHLKLDNVEVLSTPHEDSNISTRPSLVWPSGLHAIV